MINIVLSTERINDLQACPLNYYYKHELNKVPLTKASWLEEGELIHVGLKLFYEGKILGNTPIPLPTIFELTRNYATKLALTAAQVEQVITDLAMYINYWGAKGETWVIEGVEEPFAKLLYENDQLKIIITGKNDLRIMARDGRGPRVVVDHKYESKFDEKPDRDNQALCYAWAFEARDFIYNRIGKQKTKKVEEKLIRPWLSFTDHQIEDWKQSVIDTAYEILRYHNSDNWPMRIRNCNFRSAKCLFYDVCNSVPDDRQRQLDNLFKDKDNKTVMER